MSNDTPVKNGPKGEELSIVQKIVGVFTAPTKTFASVDLSPTWIVPFLITVAIGLLFIFLAGDIITNDSLDLQAEQMEKQGLTSEKIEERLEGVEKFMRYGMPVFAVLRPLVFILVISGVFMLVVSLILGGSTKFKKVFSVTNWSWLIQAVGGLLILPLVLAQETIFIPFSFATFLSEESRLTFLYAFLNELDIFNIAFVGVLSIGLAVIYKMETQKMVIAGFTVLVLWAMGYGGWVAIFA